MHWKGKVIGSGKQSIEKIEENQIDFDLQFLAPQKSEAKVSISFQKQAKGTKVTWRMDSSMPWYCFFMIPMVKTWIGMDFDRGLTMLKELAEKGKVNAKTTNEGIKNFEGFSYIGFQRTVSKNSLADIMSKDFERLVNELVHKRGLSAKHWVTVYRKFNMRNEEMTYVAAISDENLEGIDFGKDTVRGKIETGSVLELKHKGPYRFLGNAWSMGSMFVRYKKYKQTGKPFEYYWNSPYEVKEEELKTSVYFPIRKP